MNLTIDPQTESLRPQMEGGTVGWWLLLLPYKDHPAPTAPLVYSSDHQLADLGLNPAHRAAQSRPQVVCSVYRYCSVSRITE